MRKGPIEKIEQGAEQEVINLAEQVREIQKEGSACPVDLIKLYRSGPKEAQEVLSNTLFTNGDTRLVDAYGSVWGYANAVEFDQRRGREISPGLLAHAREALEIRRAIKEEVELAEAERRSPDREKIDRLMANFLRGRFDRTAEDFEAAGPEEAKKYKIDMESVRKTREQIHSVLDRKLTTSGEKPAEFLTHYSAAWIQTLYDSEFKAVGKLNHY